MAEAKSLYRLPLKQYADFRGGWNADSAPDQIADNEMAQADDLDLGVRGGISRRKPYQRMNVTSYGAAAKQTIEYTKNDGTVQILSLIGDNLCLINETDWSIDSVINAMTRDDIPHYDYGDKLFYLDGSEYRVWDGVSSRIVQLAAPATAPTLGAGAMVSPSFNFSGTSAPRGAGFRQGKYIGIVVYTNGDEKAIAVSSEVVDYAAESYHPSGTIRNTSCTWTIPTGPVGTVKRKLYRTNASQNSLYLITTINDNTTTTYDDTLYSGGSAAWISEEALFEGVYKGWVTFVQDDGFESPPSPVGVSGTLSSLVIVWSNIPIGPEGAIQRKLYRSVNGGNIGKLLTTINDNTTTTYVDTAEDNALSFVELVTDGKLSPITQCDFMVYHKKSNRIFAAKATSAEVHYSEQGRLEYFRASTFPTSGDGPVVALYIMGDAVIAKYENTAWAWRGQDPSQDAIWQKLPIPGAFSNGSIMETPASFSWLGPGGLYSTTPSILTMGDIKIEMKDAGVVNYAENKVQKVIENMGTKSAISAVYDSNLSRAYIAYPDGKESTSNTNILVFDWTLKAFTRYTGLNAVHLMRRRNGDILASTNGYIVKLNGSGTMDPDNVPIVMRFKSKPYHLDYPFHKKRLLRLYTEFKAPANGNVVISFNIYVDSILVYSRDHISTGASFVWGESTWGDANWGQRELVTTRSKISQSGHRVEVAITCDQDIDEVIVYAFAFEFRPIRARGDRI